MGRSWPALGIVVVPGVARACGAEDDFDWLTLVAVWWLVTCPLAAAVTWPFVRGRVKGVWSASWSAGVAAWTVFVATLVGLRFAPSWFAALPNPIEAALWIGTPLLAAGGAASLLLRWRHGFRPGPWRAAGLGAAMVGLVALWVLAVIVADQQFGLVRK